MENQLITDVKICGLRDKRSIDAALNGGARQIGFIFFEKSPRNIDAKLAGQLSLPLKGDVIRVAVSVNAGDDFLDDIVESMEPDVLQLHGFESPERVQEIRERYRLPAVKAFAIRQTSDFNGVEKYLGIAERMLFDAKPPAGSELPGGNGVSFDWKLFANWQDQHFGPNNGSAGENFLDSSAFPMLSGGINPDNIEIALSSSNARAIDISSGVEKLPGVKDPALITAFLEQVGKFDAQREEVQQKMRKEIG
jgi:phosphoribosylanthranilate isomerase